MTTKRLALLSLILVSTPCVFSQNPRTTKTTYYPAKPLPGIAPPTQTAAMPAIGPLFIQNDLISSSLMLVNNATASTGATVTIRSLAGHLITQRHLKLESSSQREISLSELLASGSEYAELGSLSVLQDAGTQGVAVNAQLLLSDHSHTTPAYLDEELSMPSMGGSSTLGGVTDATEGPPLLAISNLSDKSQIATVRCLIQKNAPESTKVSIPARGTSLTIGCTKEQPPSVDSYLRATRHTDHAAVQGIEITGDGDAGTLAAFAFAPHSRRGEIVLSSVPFTDPQSQKSSTMVFAGVPFGLQTSVSSGVYIPHIALTNFSANDANVTIITTTSNERHPRDGVLATEFLQSPHTKTVSLSSGESTEVVFESAANQSGLTHSITIQSDQPAGQVQSKVVSRGDGALFQVELLGKDSKDQENSGGHPWIMQGDFESHLLLFNSSAVATTYVVHLAAGKTTWQKNYVLAPHETRELSLNRIVREHIKDDSGHVLDSDVSMGVAYWSTIDPGHGTGRLLVSSKSAGSARNFSCGYTYVICGVNLSVFDAGVIQLLGILNYGSISTQACLTWGPGFLWRHAN